MSPRRAPRRASSAKPRSPERVFAAELEAGELPSLRAIKTRAKCGTDRARFDALLAEISAFCRANLSHIKAPRRIDFMAELPRHATGKLYKRLIRDAYWGKEGSRIV